MLDAKTTEKELLIMNILDILKRYVDPTRLSELNACLPDRVYLEPEQALVLPRFGWVEPLRLHGSQNVVSTRAVGICAPIAFTEKGRLLECLSGHMAYNKESKLIQDLRRESYEDEKNNPKSTGFQQKESPESLLLVFIGTFSDSM